MRLRTRASRIVPRMIVLATLVLALLAWMAVAAHAGDSSGTSTGGAGDLGIEKGLTQGSWEKLLEEVGHQKIAINFVWTLVAGALVFFMQAGFALVETGFCRARNAAHVVMTNFGIFFIGLLGFWMVGFALMFGGTQVASLGGTAPLHGLFELGKGWGLWGTKGWFLSGDSYDVGVAALFWFQVVFMDTAATIPTGAMAERWRFSAFIIYGFFISMVLYPLFGNWVWGGGWLSQIGHTLGLGHGYLDWAGSTVIHAVGGLVGLAGALVLGPRIGKYNRDGSPNPMPGHHIPMAILGTFILWYGWFAFNAGSTLAGNDLRIAVIVVNTMLAGSAGAFTAMMLVKALFGKYDPSMSANGALAGLVAITAPSAFVQPWSSVVIGAVAGALVVGSVLFLERVWKVDDPVGAISVHGTCGLWGGLALGLFADGKYGDGYNGIAGPVRGLLYGDLSQFAAQLVGVATVCIWAFGLGYLFFRIQDRLMGIRVPAEAELGGIDIPEMGAMAYPDFLEARGEVFVAPDGEAAIPRLLAPAREREEGGAAPTLRVVKNPEAAKPGAPPYFFQLGYPGLQAHLPVWREPVRGDPYVKEVYRTELLGERLERGNLSSLEAAVRQGLGGILRNEAVPAYLFRSSDGSVIPVYRQGPKLQAFVQERRFEGPDLIELHATVAEYLAIRVGPGQAGDLEVFALAPEDLRLIPPALVLSHREVWVPVFARPWGALYAEVAGQELEAGPGIEGVLALRREVGRLLRERARIYDPDDLAITGVAREIWARWEPGLEKVDEVTMSWGTSPVPAYRAGDTVVAAVPSPRGTLAVWFGRDRWDLTSRIEAEARRQALTIRGR